MAYKHVEIKFSYDMPDAYLYQSTKEGKKGSHTYKGPEKLWIFMNKMTNKRAGDPGTNDLEPDYVPPAHSYKVLVDCVEHPLICELLEPDVDEYRIDNAPYVSETLPVKRKNGEFFTHDEPETPTPDHTYEIADIEFNPNGHDPKTGLGGTWVYPLPFKKPHVSWYSLKKTRWSKLSGSDGHVHDDMPAALKKEWEDYRKILREIPQLYGASFDITIDAGGTGYSAGDKFVVPASSFGFKDSDLGQKDDLSQPMGWRPGFDHYDASLTHRGDIKKPTDPKTAILEVEGLRMPGDNPEIPEGVIAEVTPTEATPGIPAGEAISGEKMTLDLTVIVEAVDGDGAITEVRTRNAFMGRHIKEAMTVDESTATTSASGTGFEFTLSKVARIDPWKCRFPDAPNEREAQWEGKRVHRYLTDEDRENPADGFLMEHTYHPATNHYIPPEMGGNYFAKDLARLNLSTNDTAFDDGDDDGLPAAPTNATGKVRVVGTVTARKQS